MQLSERKAIITGGPTREWLDPVRFISNPSTGKMGAAIADVCAGRARETCDLVQQPHPPARKSEMDLRRLRPLG